MIEGPRGGCCRNAGFVQDQVLDWPRPRPIIEGPCLLIGALIEGCCMGCLIEGGAGRVARGPVGIFSGEA